MILTLLFIFALLLIYPSSVFAQNNPVNPVSLIKTFDSSVFSPPSPDPAGITYLPADRLLISDSEADEMSIFAGINLFEISLEGNLLRTSNTVSFSHEPTGVSFDPQTNQYYFSDDDKDRIFTVNPGPDNSAGTPDDIVTSFSSAGFGATDLEGLVFAQNSIFIAGGSGKKVCRVSPSGKLLYSFDVGVYSILDFEGITYNPDLNSLFILSRNPKKIIETDLNGILKNTFDISVLNSHAPADLTFAPSSSLTDDPLITHLYIVDRGVDNNADPNENDGKIYELSLNLTPPSPLVSPTIYAKPGDANGDSRVDGIDYVIWLNNYNK